MRQFHILFEEGNYDYFFARETRFTIKEPKNLSPRIQWLRDYYFQGTKHNWNNEFTAWTMGTDWDLPEELLPVNWLRFEVTAPFDQYHELLMEQVN